MPDRIATRKHIPLTDAEMLTTVADWFDVRDDEEGVTDPTDRQVQQDLRRIARRLRYC